MRPDDPSAAQPPGKRLGLRLVAVLLLLAAPVAIYAKTAQYLDSRNSPNWPRVPGEVTEMTGYEVTYKRQTGQAAYVKYRYEVNGKRYTGTDIALDRASIPVTDEERLNKYQPGRTPTVYHSPSDPTNAVLEPGVGPTAILGLLAPWVLPVIAVGLLVLSRSPRPVPNAPDT